MKGRYCRAASTGPWNGIVNLCRCFLPGTVELAFARPATVPFARAVQPPDETLPLAEADAFTDTLMLAEAEA
jgi:hypothetical protein